MDKFIECKNVYFEMRKEQKKILCDFLKQNGYEVLNEKGGMGISSYTSGNTFNKPYDLSNWMWIEVRRNDVFYFISFQAFDIDPSSKNVHVLMDRIGVYKYKKYSAKEAFENMVITDIDLPFGQDELKELIKYLV